MKLYQKTLATQVRFPSTNLTYTILQKEMDLSRQIKSEVRTLKADVLANHITDNLEYVNSKPLFAHIKRSRGQSGPINRAC